MNRTDQFNKKRANMSDKELIELVGEEISKLAQSGGRSHTMCVPPMITDTDMLFSELSNRFESLLKRSEAIKDDLPTVEKAGVIAVGMSENLKAQEQSFFIAGFQECIKFLNEQKEPFKPCGEGDNICNCKSADECGYSIPYEEKEPNQPDEQEQEQLMYEEGFADGKISESKNPELLKALTRLDSEANIKAIQDHTKEVTKSKKSATKFLTDGEYLDELKEPNQPEEDINTTKGAEKYLKRHDIDIDSYVEKGLKKITRVLKSNPNTSEEVKNKVRQILKKEKEEQPRVSKTEIRNGMSYRLDTKTGMYEPDVNGLNKISIITEGEQSEEKECEHDEGMKQGDGFVYSVCKKCGKDLE